MVEIDVLASLDALIWLRTGAAVAERFGVTQSTVSRNSSNALQCFELELTKLLGEWELQGDATLIGLERRVHQKHRWQGGRPLRLEAQYWLGPQLCQPLGTRWLAGNFDFLEVARPLQLLRDSVVDAWLGCAPDLPPADDPEIACFPLSRSRTFLVVGDGHPLLSHEGELTLEDLRHFPQLPTPENAFPKVQAVMEQLGLWRPPANWRRYRPDRWEARPDLDLTVSLATALTLGLFQTPQHRLPVHCPLMVGEVLLVRRDYADHPDLQTLVALLRERLRPWVQRHPGDIELLEGALMERDPEAPVAVPA